MSLSNFVSMESFASCTDPSIAQTTVYYLPDAQKICGSYGVQCEKFLSEVKMQGSGRLFPQAILRSSGQIEMINHCATTIGASRDCLIPYLSVAADPEYYEKGDIIRMPSFKGLKVKLPNGKVSIHPGYFIVHDVGGRITGESRFDFFTIDVDLHHADNSFGYRAKPSARMYSIDSCEDYKKFEIISPDSAEYTLAKMEIDKFNQKIK